MRYLTQEDFHLLSNGVFAHLTGNSREYAFKWYYDYKQPTDKILNILHLFNPENMSDAYRTLLLKLPERYHRNLYEIKSKFPDTKGNNYHVNLIHLVQAYDSNSEIPLLIHDDICASSIQEATLTLRYLLSDLSQFKIRRNQLRDGFFTYNYQHILNTLHGDLYGDFTERIKEAYSDRLDNISYNKVVNLIYAHRECESHLAGRQLTTDEYFTIFEKKRYTLLEHLIRKDSLMTRFQMILSMYLINPTDIETYLSIGCDATTLTEIYKSDYATKDVIHEDVWFNTSYRKLREISNMHFGYSESEVVATLKSVYGDTIDDLDLSMHY